jgi:hypothetical protein
LKGLGTHVTLKLYEGVSKHTRPPDFMTQFATWMGAFLKPEEEALIHPSGPSQAL